jgi:hypothetical protein
MLVSLSEHQATRQRLWIGELPDIKFVAETALSKTFPAAVPTITSPSMVAVEKWLPVSGMNLYGIVGALYDPQPIESLQVIVHIREQTDELLDWTLGSQTDTVYAGLYPEYADAILESFAESRKLQGGTLTIHHAAHGLIGSSPHIFKEITRTLISILFSADVWNFVAFAQTEITA